MRGRIEKTSEGMFVKFQEGDSEQVLPLHIWDGKDAMLIVGTGIELNFEVFKMKIFKNDCRCNSMEEFLKCDHYVGPPINDCTFGDMATTSFAKIIRDSAFFEAIATVEFGNVGDDGLFPNHTDRDIWVSGFRSGCEYYSKNFKK